MRARTRVIVAAVVAVTAGVGADRLVAAHRRASAAGSFRLGRDGTTAPIDSYARAIRETVWVDLGVDQDGDGVDDRVAADIIRPAEPASAGRRIPTIMDVSGYYQTLGRGAQMQPKSYDAEGRPVTISCRAAMPPSWWISREPTVLPDARTTAGSPNCCPRHA